MMKEEVEVGVEVLHREKEDGGEVEERSLPQDVGDRGLSSSSSRSAGHHPLL